MESVASDLEMYFSGGFPLLTNLDISYQSAPVEIQRKTIGSIFPGKLIFDGENYRTARLNEVLSLIINNQDTFRKAQKKTDRNYSDRSTQAPQVGLEPTTL